MRAIKNFDIILFASSCLFCLLTFHEASVKKLEEIIGGILMPRQNAKTVIQCTPLKLIYFLTFDEASAKNWKKTFHESSVKKYMKSLMSLIVCHNVFFSF